jgi:hypothetical protein
MNRSVSRTVEMDGLSSVLKCVERRLGIALALLLLGIIVILGLTVSQPVTQYLFGPQMQISAAIEGEGCGSHLEWEMESREIAAGSRISVTNDAVYWMIPVVIERMESDGSFRVVAESPSLRSGESWSYTFWKRGDYQISSADATQRLAGLETTISVK